MEKDLPIGYISRSLSLSSSHRLHSNKLTDEENKKIFGKCNHVNSHGHNYKIKVTLRGPVNRSNGMIMNLTDLKYHMEEITEIFDHKNIDKDIPHFQDTVSTAENISIFIWKLLEKKIPSPEILYEVKVKETDHNTACYRGE